jgi:hypothetical protein
VEFEKKKIKMCPHTTKNKKIVLILHMFNTCAMELVERRQAHHSPQHPHSLPVGPRHLDVVTDTFSVDQPLRHQPQLVL